MQINTLEPVILKLFQMILATLIGGAISIIGIFYFEKGVSGKTSFLVKSSGLTAKLINGTPGLVICLIGALVIYFSLNSGATYIQESGDDQNTSKIEIRVGINDKLIPLYDFLLSSANNNDSLDKTFLEVITKAKNDNYTLVLRVLNSDGDTTLSELSNKYYKNIDYWKIIKWANSDNLPEDVDKRYVIPSDKIILIPFFLSK